MKPFELFIVATISLSKIIAIFHIIQSFLNKNSIQDRFGLFMYSFLGGLLGGFIGTIVGLLLAHLIYLLFPPQTDFGPNIFYGFYMMIFISSLWLMGVLTGGINTLKPLIRFFSNK